MLTEDIISSHSYIVTAFKQMLISHMPRRTAETNNQ